MNINYLIWFILAALLAFLVWKRNMGGQYAFATPRSRRGVAWIKQQNPWWLLTIPIIVIAIWLLVVGPFTLTLGLPLAIVGMILSIALSKAELKKWSASAQAIAWIVLLIGAWGSFGSAVTYTTRYLERCVNAECGNDADYVPTYHGGTLHLRGGESKTVKVVGTIRLDVPVGYAPHANPPIFRLEQNSTNSIAWFTPCDPTVNKSTISLITAYQAKEVKAKTKAKNDCS